MFEAFGNDVTAQRIFEGVDPLAFLQDFLDSADEHKENGEIADSITNSPAFAAYHAQVAQHSFPTIYRGNNVWIVPAYDAENSKLKPHKYQHVFFLPDGWSCDCNAASWICDCIHVILVQLVTQYDNPTALTLNLQSKFVKSLGINTVLQIESSKESKCSSVWSVNSPNNGGQAIVHVNESSLCVSCSVCVSGKWCEHRNAVNDLVLDYTGGELDVQKTLREARNPRPPEYDPSTGDLSVFDLPRPPKDLSSNSKKRIPVPYYVSTNADAADNEAVAAYYDSTPVHLREFPSKLKPKSTHCSECSAEYKSVEVVSGANYYTLSGSYIVDVCKNVCTNEDCLHFEDYDGFDDHVFWKKRSLWSHAFMNEWTVQRQKAATTLTSFYNTKRCTFYNSGCINDKDKPDLPSIVDFTEAYQTFVNLQLWNQKLQCDGCIAVGQLPQIVGMDVTQILIKYEKLMHICTAQESYILHPEDEVVKMRKVVNETPMVYVVSPSVRKELKQFLIGKKVRIYSKVNYLLSGFDQSKMCCVHTGQERAQNARLQLDCAADERAVRQARACGMLAAGGSAQVVPVCAGQHHQSAFEDAAGRRLEGSRQLRSAVQAVPETSEPHRCGVHCRHDGGQGADAFHCALSGVLCADLRCVQVRDRDLAFLFERHHSRHCQEIRADPDGAEDAAKEDEWREIAAAERGGGGALQRSESFRNQHRFEADPCSAALRFSLRD